jgi:iron(III) transport system substrate-binding protein
MVAAPFVARQAFAADTLNAYSIWPENYARPMMEAFEKETGIHVKFIRFSSGEALARVTAEKNNPQIDVLFGGPVETFTAGQTQGIFEPYTPSSAAGLPARFKDKGGAWTAIADDPLVFMTNTQFLKQNNLQAPTSWDDLLNPAYKNMLQMADARTSGTAVTRIFSVLQVHNRNEDEAFAYMKKLRQNVQLYTKSGGGGTLPVGLGQAGGGIFFIVDALFTRQQGYDVQISFPQGGHRFRGGVHRTDQGRQESGCGQETDRLGDKSGNAVAFRAQQDQFHSGKPESRNRSRPCRHIKKREHHRNR